MRLDYTKILTYLIIPILTIIVSYKVLYDYWLLNIEKITYLVLFACLWAALVINSRFLSKLSFKNLKSHISIKELVVLLLFSLVLSPILAFTVYKLLNLKIGALLGLLAISFPLGSGLAIKFYTNIRGEENMDKVLFYFVLIVLIAAFSVPIYFKIANKLVKPYLEDVTSINAFSEELGIYNAFAYCPISGLCSNISNITIFVVLVIVILPIILGKLGIYSNKLSKYGNLGILVSFLLMPFIFHITIKIALAVTIYYTAIVLLSFLLIKYFRLDSGLLVLFITRFISISLVAVYSLVYTIVLDNPMIAVGAFETILFFFLLQYYITPHLSKKLSQYLSI